MSRVHCTPSKTSSGGITTVLHCLSGYNYFYSLFIIYQFDSFQLMTRLFSALRYTGDWAMVSTCTGITRTYCDLSSLINDYGIGYKVKVQLTKGEDSSAWTMKKFLPNRSKHNYANLDRLECNMVKNTT